MTDDRTHRTPPSGLSATPSSSERPPRRPRDYVGARHETIGSDLLSVRDALLWMSGDKSDAAVAALCRQVLGAEAAQRIESVKPEQWYPIAWMLSMLDAVDAKVGPNGLRRLGRVLFQRTHAAVAKQRFRTAREALQGLDALYRNANRGDRIGGWRALSFGPTSAEIEKTTPHHCVMEEGILVEACAAMGVSVVVAQRGCFRKGADACVYVVSPMSVGDPAWGA